MPRMVNAYLSRDAAVQILREALRADGIERLDLRTAAGRRFKRNAQVLAERLEREEHWATLLDEALREEL